MPDSDSFLLRLLPRSVAARLAGRGELVGALQNINWLLGQRIFDSVLGITIGVIITRYLGPERYGVLSYLMALVGMLAPLANLGTNGIAVRDIVADQTAAETILGSGAAVRLLSGLAMAVLCAGAVLVLRPGETDALVMVLVMASGYVAMNSNMLNCWFHAKVEARYVVISASASKALFALMKLAFVATGAGLMLFALAIGAELWLTTILMVGFYMRSTSRSPRSWRVDWQVARRLVQDGWPLMLGGFMSVIYLRCDQLMLGELRDDRAVGIYAAAVTFSAAIHALASPICNSVFPALMAARKQSRELYMARFHLLYDSLIWLAVAAALGVSLIASPMIDLLLGDRYQETALVLTVHVWSSVLVFSGAAGQRYLLAENLTRISLVMTTVGAVINVVANFLLIPRYGPSGAAYATLISFLFSHLFAAALFADSRVLLQLFIASFNPLGLLRRWRPVLAAGRRP